MDFNSFGFDPSLEESLFFSGYKTPTPIQQKAIPVILEGKDLIASAQTGTGKTAAFLLPILNKLITGKFDEGDVHALIIVPTRELATQISGHLDGLAYFSNISSIAIYGGGDGESFVQEKKALSKGADIVVATPGKLISHLNMGYVRMKNLKFLILDEADRMLDMGFFEDIMRIISHLPKERQTLLFSATMPVKIRELAKSILVDPIEVNVAISKPPDAIKQTAYVVYEEQKIPVVKNILSHNSFQSVLIFCSKKQTVKMLTAQLRKNGINAKEIHSDLEQQQREDVLLEFSSKRLPVLVATDILSRGIHIDSIELVINFDVPSDGEDYVHRIGRTARAQTKGAAITLINPDDQRKFRRIEELIGKEIEKSALPKEIGIGPEFQKQKSFSKKSFSGKHKGDVAEPNGKIITIKKRTNNE